MLHRENVARRTSSIPARREPPHDLDQLPSAGAHTLVLDPLTRRRDRTAQSLQHCTNPLSTGLPVLVSSSQPRAHHDNVLPEVPPLACANPKAERRYTLDVDDSQPILHHQCLAVPE